LASFIGHNHDVCGEWFAYRKILLIWNIPSRLQAQGSVFH
jgi:hypothetical protein